MSSEPKSICQRQALIPSKWNLWRFSSAVHSIGRYRQTDSVQRDGVLASGDGQLLGPFRTWGDGTESEFFTIQELVEKFSISRVNKACAVFYSPKLSPLNSSPFSLEMDEWATSKSVPTRGAD